MSKLWYFQPVRRQPQAFEQDYVQRLKVAILESPYLSASTLNERFSTTRGFSVTFRKDGMPRLFRVFPIFQTFIERLVEKGSNAFFLNPLVLARGTWVSPHIDCSLRTYTKPEQPPWPTKVSVLYVDVPQPFEGGTLILHRSKPVARVTPESNLLVEFLGNLKHEVSAVERCGTEEQPASRISLVCEHYRLSAEMLDMIPTFYLHTKRKFEDFLGEAQGEDGEVPAEEEPPETADPAAVGVAESTAVGTDTLS